MQIFPNNLSRLVNQAGTLLAPWIQYLQQFTQAPPNFVTLTVGPSPFSYIVKEPGNLIITGGAISAVALVRGSIGINLVGQRIVPVSIQDTVTFTYTIKPVVQFIPIYGAVPA